MSSYQNPKEKYYVYLLAAIQIAHIIDFVIMMPLGPVLMESFQIGPSKFAALVSSYNFSGAITGIIFSVFADRFDRKKILISSMSGFIIGTFLCGFSSGYSQLLAARVVTGCFGGVLNACVMAIVTDLIPYERRGRALGIIMSSFSVSSVVGIPLGLAISDYLGWHMSFFAIGSFAFIVCLLGFFIFPNIKEHVKKEKPAEVLLQFGRMFLNNLSSGKNVRI